MFSRSVFAVSLFPCSVDSGLGHRVPRVTFSWRISRRHRSGSRTILPWTISSWSTLGLWRTRACYRCPHNADSCHSHLVQCFPGISRRWFRCHYEGMCRHISCFRSFWDDVPSRVYRHKGHVEVLNQVFPFMLGHVCQTRSCSCTGVSVTIS